MNEPNMNQEDILDEEAQVEMSPEEYKKAREDAQKQLKEEIKYLKVEEEYWRLLADVEEHKTRRITMVARRAAFYQKQEPETDPEQMSEQPTAQPNAEKPAADNPSKKPEKRNLKTN